MPEIRKKYDRGLWEGAVRVVEETGKSGQPPATAAKTPVVRHSRYCGAHDHATT